MQLTKAKKIITNIVVVLILAAAVIYAQPASRAWVKDKINLVFPELCRYQVYYQNNQKVYSPKKLDFAQSDIKEIQVGNNKKYMINHSRGFAMEFPRDMEFDFTSGNEFITAKNDHMTMVVSKEFSPYDDTRSYIRDYLHKYLLDPRFMEQNRLTLHKNSVEKIGDFWIQVVMVSRTPAPGSDVAQNTYAYCYIYDEEQRYYRILFKDAAYTPEFIDQVYKTLYSFSLDVPIQGISQNYTDYQPVENPHWSKETKAYYEKLCNSDKLEWGIFIPQGVRDMKHERVTEIEKKIDYKFTGMIEYIYFEEDFPVEGMQAAYDDNKIVELTLQTATVMNEDLNGYCPVFDILDGRKDEHIRVLARQAKEFGHPFLFRLNNEMNSDWTSYCGSVLLNDPSLYVQLWQRFYDIFEEEGVDNAIWVFNPNNLTFPPCGYNDPMAYYPGNEYVHVFGVTAYNTGTYYAEEFGEKWREFEELYDETENAFQGIYGKFPWIITEFASSSIGGDKVQWIKNMFSVLHKYPNIKMAFWFNSADWDPDYPKETVISRPYWLDETEETLQTFGELVKQE